jgi:flagellar biosynthesis/type III secretory pathway chaperone
VNLLEVVEKIKNINNINKKLIDSSVEYIDFNVNLILGSGGQGTYGSQGNIQDMNAGFKAFDKKM